MKNPSLRWTQIWADPSVAVPEGIPRRFALPIALPERRDELSGAPVFWAQAGEMKYCLATRDVDGNAQWAFPISAWLASCRSLMGREPKQPFYTKVPGFNINYLPYWLRDFLFQNFFNSARNLEPVLSQSAGIDCLVAIAGLVFGRNVLAEFAPPRWPNGKRASLIFTMDVDSDHIFHAPRNILLEKLEAKNFKSAWYFLTGRYPLNHQAIESLAKRGHEIGWHGHNHDHRLGFVSRRGLEKRIEKARPFFERYAVEGMRVENFLWSRPLLQQIQPLLGYDTSLRDSYPMVEEGGGSSTSVPFQSPDGTWALPTSITGDHCLPPTWTNAKKMDLIAQQIDLRIATGGVIHLLFHPEPDGTLLPRNLELFDLVLERLDAKREQIWHCLPKELYAFCRG